MLPIPLSVWPMWEIKEHKQALYCYNKRIHITRVHFTCPLLLVLPAQRFCLRVQTRRSRAKHNKTHARPISIKCSTYNAVVHNFRSVARGGQGAMPPPRIPLARPRQPSSGLLFCNGLKADEMVFSHLPL